MVRPSASDPSSPSAEPRHRRRQPAGEHHPQHGGRVRAERHADADLLRPCRDRLMDDAVHADHRQDQRARPRAPPAASSAGVAARRLRPSRCSTVTMPYGGTVGSSARISARIASRNGPGSPSVLTAMSICRSDARLEHVGNRRLVEALPSHVGDDADDGFPGHLRTRDRVRTSSACRPDPGPASTAAPSLR